jgi:hypothetical protein
VKRASPLDAPNAAPKIELIQSTHPRKSKDYRPAMGSMEIGRSEVEKRTEGSTQTATPAGATPAKAAVGDEPVFAYIQPSAASAQNWRIGRRSSGQDAAPASSAL